MVTIVPWYSIPRAKRSDCAGLAPMALPDWGVGTAAAAVARARVASFLYMVDGMVSGWVCVECSIVCDAVGTQIKSCLSLYQSLLLEAQ